MDVGENFAPLNQTLILWDKKLCVVSVEYDGYHKGVRRYVLTSTSLIVCD